MRIACTVNSLKQASAFPPNFIHSLDATHMMLSALECRVCFFVSSYFLARDVDAYPFQTQGLTFASVHDSYWTHASTIDKMSEIIRETFIALHSANVLVNLREEVSQAYT
jgi:DNA-directed RNA polymerase, mitochondrial